MIYDKENSKISIDELGDFAISKEPIYSDDVIVFTNGQVFGDAKPIGYELKLSSVNKSDLQEKKY